MAVARWLPGALALAVSFGPTAMAADLAPLTAAIRAVGPEGAGHTDAARAWGELIQAEPAQLPDVLAGMDGANALAANWIALAAGTIAERAAEQGAALPAAALERFLGDRRHAPRARFMAYEWLAAASPAHKRRLLAGVLDDPSLEIRRDAVAQALGDAIRAQEADGFQKAAPLYRSALTAARDPDQVRQIADRLRKGGEAVDLPRHFGFLVRWRVIGPFDNAGGKGFDAEYPPEKDLNPAAEHPGKHGPVKWLDYAAADDYGTVDLNKALGEEKDVAAYAAAEYLSDKAQEVQLRLTSFNAVKLWLNGKLVAKHQVYHSGSQLDQYVVRVALQPGKNTLLVKVCQNNIQQEWARYWQIQLRVCDEQGTAVPPAEGGPKDGKTADSKLKIENCRLKIADCRLQIADCGWCSAPNPQFSIFNPQSSILNPQSSIPPPADWRQFRGTDNNPASDGGAPPVELGPEKNLAWKAPLPGRGPASPIVVGGRVFVTCSGGPRQDQLHVICFDGATGKALWQRRFWATGSTACNPFGAVAAPTPASDGRMVYAFFSSNDLAAFDLDGNLKWLRGLGYEHPDARNDVGMASSPVVAGGTVVVQCENYGDSFAAGLDAATGATRWRIERDRGSMWASPTVLRGHSPDEDLVLMQSRPGLTAHEPRTGRVAWRHEAGCHSMASAVAAAGRVYLPAGGLQALEYDRETKAVKVLWRQQRLVCGAPSPVVRGNRVYTIKDPGILVCGDLADGRVLWQLRLKGPVWATPVLAAGRLYAVNHGGLVQVVRLEEGEKEGKVVAEGQIDGGILATPAVSGGAIYFRSDAHLWKFAAPRQETAL